MNASVIHIPRVERLLVSDVVIIRVPLCVLCCACVAIVAANIGGVCVEDGVVSLSDEDVDCGDDGGDGFSSSSFCGLFCCTTSSTAPSGWCGILRVIWGDVISCVGDSGSGGSGPVSGVSRGGNVQNFGEIRVEC